ncbi:hypothetical protein QP185_13260 [Sphingomonas aerolata]
MQHGVQADRDRHQTVIARSSRIRAPIRKTRASTKIITTAIHPPSDGVQ